jgi:hypothetical protein
MARLNKDSKKNPPAKPVKVATYQPGIAQENDQTPMGNMVSKAMKKK